MKRSPELLAKVMRLIHMKVIHYSDNENDNYHYHSSFRIDRSALRFLSGQIRLDHMYMLDLERSLRENGLMLLKFNKFFVVSDLNVLFDSPLVPLELYMR